ncbi:MAG TPA: adenylate/guanylate cyclase domain-containing protein [Alphaproteobacteria bacterium]|jgi:class 3 adenylate cyclase|nr:adenylate/guanylate cyclase domain-containing protein [Alphaproteobacteria bacterium]
MPTTPPKTRYAKSGDVHVAYQTLGEGPLDLVIAPGFVSNLDLVWEWPPLADMIERLAGYARVTLFDKRGTGLSDRVGGVPPLEERMDDVRAVMDAAGIDQAAVMGISEGGSMAALFAATYPARTRSLVLYGAFTRADDWTIDRDRLKSFFNTIPESWGSGSSASAFAPTLTNDASFRDWWARFERLGASPAALVDLLRSELEIDIRPILRSIRVPTLIVHRTDDTLITVEAARLMARDIPDAKLVELPGRDHLMWVGDVDAVTDAIVEFLTGAAPVEEPDRVLATVMFTDIVDSTRRAAALGDHDWRALLDRHREDARRSFARFRGREVQHTGDGFLATFDGPARAIRCAAAVSKDARALGLELRAGLHTGEITVAGDDISGIAVHMAARIAASAAPGEVLVSATVKDLVAGSGLRFRDRGSWSLKGIETPMPLYAADVAPAAAASGTP